MSLLRHSYPPIDLAGATVAVTGGGRGIGRATAAAFARAGAKVALGDLDHATAAEAARAIGPAATAFDLDVTSADSFKAFLDAVQEEVGPLDVLVNNAGVMPIAAFLEEPDSISATTLDVNVWGPINGMRFALPDMIERGRGHVVNVASLAGKTHLPGLAVYCASKHAVVGLSAAVRDEVESAGVSVSTVLPTLVKSELSAGVPLGRGLPAVEPEDIAAAVVKSVETRRAEIAVPAWSGVLAAAMAVTPRPLMRLARRAIGDDRALTSLDHGARASYQQRVEGQADTHERVHAIDR